MNESEFQTIVIDMARLFKWRVAHFRPAMTSKGWRTPVSADGKGFPDLVLVKSWRLIFAELKTDRGRVSTEQQEWLDALPDSCIWRPKDLDDGTIERILRSGMK